MTKYFKSHRRLAFWCFLIWLSGALLGVYISVGEFSPEGVRLYISGIASAENSFGQIFLNGLSANMIFVCEVFLSSVFVPLLPLSFLALAFRGFSSSLASGLLIRYFALGGVWVSLGTVVLPMAFALPLQFMFFISSADMAFRLRSGKGDSSVRRELITAQLLRVFLLFTVLCAISAVEAMVSPYIFLLIKGLDTYG